MAKTGFSSSSD